MKNYLIKELTKRVKETRLREEFKQKLIIVFRRLDNNLLEDLLKLNQFDFNSYLGFLYKLSIKKQGLLIYEEKLNRITKLILPKIETINVNYLLNLLINTNLFDNKDIIEFTTMFLDITNKSKIEAIYTIIDENPNLNLIQITSLIKEINESVLLEQVTYLFLKETITKSRDFKEYINLIINNLDNPNLLFFIRLLYIKELRELPNSLEIYIKYILNGNPDNHREVFDALNHVSLIKSRYLKEVLKILNECPKDFYNDILMIINKKDYLKDRCFYLILKNLLKCKYDFEKKFIFGLLNNERIVNNEVELKKALEFLNKTKYEDKLVTFYKLFIKGGLKNENLYSEYALIIQDAIIKATSNYQLNTLIKVSSKLKTSIYRNAIIKIIINSKNKYALIEYEEIINKLDILNRPDILEILLRLNGIKNESQASVITKLLTIKTDKILLLIDEVLKNKDIKLLYIMDFINKCENKNLIYLVTTPSFLEKVLTITESYKYDFLMQILDMDKLFISKDSEIIEEFLSVKEEYKYIGLLDYIKINIQDEKFNLNNYRSKMILELIKNANKDYQVRALIRISKIVKGNKLENKVLSSVIKIDDSKKCILLGDLLESKILNDSRIDDILDNFYTCNNTISQVGMVELANNSRLRKSNFLVGYFMIMKRLKKFNQVGILLRILDNYNDLNDYNLFKYCEKIMFVTNYKLLLMLEKLIMNNKKLDKETIDLCILAIDEHSNQENISFIKEYLKINDIDLEETPKVMYMLDK